MLKSRKFRSAPGGSVISGDESMPGSRRVSPGLLNRLSGWVAGLTKGGEAATGAEQLESRVMLSAEALPSGTSWVEWGNGHVAALTGSYVITYETYIGDAAAVERAREIGNRLGVAIEGVRSIGRAGWAELITSDRVTSQAAARVTGELNGVRAIEPTMVYASQRLPNDPQLGQQWSLKNTGQFIQGVQGTPNADIRAEQAWNTTVGTRDAVVAVIDTGVNYNHEDLSANMWRNPGEVAGNGLDDDGNGFVDDVFGFDFADLDSDPLDSTNQRIGGHGTQVASVIAATGNNGVGITGVAWSASIMALKVGRDNPTANDLNGFLPITAIVSAFDYVVLMRGRGVNVVAVNGSYGAVRTAAIEDDADVPANVNERAAIERLIASGGTFVVAAGNDALDNDQFLRSYPASYNIPGVIAVAATDNNDGLATFSNYGAQNVDLAAPGVNIWMARSTGGYGFNSGTSFSAPTVAGAVALMKTIKPDASAVAIREALINSADPLPSLQGRVRSGGRLNVERALQIIGASGPLVQEFQPGPVFAQVAPGTTTPVSSLRVGFSQDLNTSLLSTAGVTVTGAGLDGAFGTGDDTTIPLAANGVRAVVGNPRAVTIALNLAGFPGLRLPVGQYRVVLDPAYFRDTNGNFLNGNASSGSPANINFRVVATTGDTEPNDSLAQATVVPVGGSGEARFSGVTLGNGVFSNLDVDFYRIDLPRGGQITSEVIASRRTGGSTLDSYMRLFNASGQEIRNNDSAFGFDAGIDVFVTTGGSYYIAVSGFGNSLYNPQIPGSGASQSLGVYDLKVNVQLSNDDVLRYTSAANSLVGQPAFPINIPRGGEPNPPPPSQSQGVTTAGILVTDSRQILDVNVSLSLTHDFVSDLRISLISPRGTEVLLFDRRGSSGQNMTNTIFDDEATAPIASGLAPYTGLFRPEVVTGGNGLGRFDGESAAGTWTLKVDDTTAIHNGRLLSWQLEFVTQNNIFGPFESNDTLATANALTQVRGTGTTTRDAFLGDGGFGSRDRDLFRFEADAGTTLNVNVTVPTTSLFDSLLRLFDSTGRQLLISNPTDSRNSGVSAYVFAQGGTYYLGVSEANNAAYDPTTTAINTSNPAVTTGDYTLSVDLAAGVGDAANKLSGTRVVAGVNANGTLSAPNPAPSNANNRLGLEFAGVDFLPQPPAGVTAPIQFFGLSTGGFSFVNNGFGQTNDLPMTLTVRSDPFNNATSNVGFFRGLKVQRDFAFAQGDGFVAIDVFVTNTTGAPVNGITWMDAFNPSPGQQRNNVRSTSNNIAANGRYASAVYTSNDFQSGLTFALAAPAADTRARVNVIAGNSIIRDAAFLRALPVNDPDGFVDDSRLAISYDLGDLAPGATSRMRYFILLGNSPTEAQGLYDRVNAGTGTGFLTATVTGTGAATQISTASPATEQLLTGASSPTLVPQLPYKLYYPEGFYGDNIYTFVPIGNSNDQDTRVVVIARYEAQYNSNGQITNPNRDQLVADTVIPANSRGGITLTTPEIFRAGGALAGRPNSAYSIEIRSERPVSATFSHYDLALLPTPEAIGESFTNRVSTEWSFGKVTKGAGQQDFVLFYNTSATDTVVVTTFYPLNGGTRTYEVGFVTPAFRRGGLDVNRVTAAADVNNPNGPRIDLPDGEYGVVVRALVPIVAAVSYYDRANIVSEGVIGNIGIGSAVGVSPEGQFGLNAQSESIGVLNANSETAVVLLNFIFQNGSSYRTSISVNANSYNRLDVQSLPNFPAGQPYGVSYESRSTSGAPLAVSVNNPSNAFGDQLQSSFADRAYTMWSFGEGFRPRDGGSHPGVTEYLRLYNPQVTDTTVEVTVSYAGTPGSETFRRTLPARRVTEFNMDQFITGGRRTVTSYFTTTVKAASPIVAYFGHYDRFFPGAFGMLGTPMGISAALV